MNPSPGRAVYASQGNVESGQLRRDFTGDLGNGSGPTLRCTSFSGDLRVQQ